MTRRQENEATEVARDYRPIEEMIGWTAWRRRPDGPVAGWIEGDPLNGFGPHTVRSHAEVDDLLEWLRSNITTSWESSGRHNFLGWGDWKSSTGWEHVHRGETYFETLSLAVRQVADDAG